MERRALSTISTPTLATLAHQRLREAIAMQELRPGEKVTERGLAQLLGVSATPVREAIARLVQEGLVERVGAKTLRVAVVEKSTSQELIEVETGLRGLVARFSARNITDVELRTLDSLLDEAQSQVDALSDVASLTPEHEAAARQLLRHMRAFNDVFERSCHNPVLLALLGQARGLTPREQVELSLERMREGAFGGRERWKYHQDLLEALRVRDQGSAESLTLRHAHLYLTELVLALE